MRTAACSSGRRCGHFEVRDVAVAPVDEDMAGRVRPVATVMATVSGKRLRSDAAAGAGAGAAAGGIRAPGAYTRAPDSASHIRPLHIEPDPRETPEVGGGAFTP